MIAVRRSHSRIVGSAVAACVDIILIRHVILTHHLGTALYLTGLNGRVMSSKALVSLLSTFFIANSRIQSHYILFRNSLLL